MSSIGLSYNSDFLMSHMDELQNRRKQIDARIAQMQARNKDQQRRQETRAKIVLGSAVAKLARHDPEIRTQIENAIPMLVQARDQVAVLKLLKASAHRN